MTPNSNNDIMWDCMESIFDDKYSANLRVQVEDYLHDYEINNGKEINYNFSRDNFETIICFLKYFNKDKDTVPLFGRHNLHPTSTARPRPKPGRMSSPIRSFGFSNSPLVRPAVFRA